MHIARFGLFKNRDRQTSGPSGTEGMLGAVYVWVSITHPARIYASLNSCLLLSAILRGYFAHEKKRCTRKLRLNGFTEMNDPLPCPDFQST